MKRINVGCGDVPTEGWDNYDNSFTVRVAYWPLLAAVLEKFGVLSSKQLEFVRVVKQQGVKYANAVKGIPEPDASVEALYTCHMFEHLDRDEAEQFLKEARRVLISGGILRVAVPDLRFHVENYNKDADADTLVGNLFMAVPKTRGLLGKLKYLLVGERHHLWMYDGQSLCRLLQNAGFRNPLVLPAGETTIPNPGKLDLAERAPESVFVEAVNP